MKNHSSVQFIKYALVAHIHLAACRFFRRTAVYMDSRAGAADSGKGQGRTDAHGCNQIVPASMANLRKGIVLR